MVPKVKKWKCAYVERSLVVVVMAVGCYGSGGGQSVDLGENNQQSRTTKSFHTPLEIFYSCRSIQNLMLDTVGAAKYKRLIANSTSSPNVWVTS